MRVILAKTAGFCYGVERAVALAHETAKAHGGAMLGSVIHNANVVAELEREGMRLIASPEEAAAGETVLIRSHGESREVLEELQARGAEIVSATCPNVRHIQILVTEAETAGRQVVIIGEHDHPEVQGIAGWCRDAGIFGNAEEVEKWAEETAEMPTSPNDGRANHLYSCTLGKLREKTKKECTNLEFDDTICGATSKRQEEAHQIAAQCDAMVVIGDR